jgi:hypothetical protein
MGQAGVARIAAGAALLVAVLASSLPAQVAAPLRLERTFRLSGGRSQTLQFSADGTQLASGGERGEVLVYDVASGELRHRLSAGGHWIGRVCFSPDGRRLAAVGDRLRVFSLRGGELLHDSPCANPRALDWSGDGRRLCVLRKKGYAELLDGATFEVVRSLPIGDDLSADVIAFDRASKRVAVGTRRRETLVFDATSGDLSERRRQAGWVHDMVWLGDGRLLRLGWYGKLQGLGKDRSVGILGVSLDATADGSTVLVRNGQGLLRIVDGGEPEPLGDSGPVALCADGSSWARVVDGAIELHARGAAPRRLANLHARQTTSAILTSDGRHAALAPSFRSGSIEIFEVASGRRLPVAGLPEDATFLENRSGVELALMVLKSNTDERERRELQLWKISGGRKPRVDLVRSVPFELELRQRGGHEGWPSLSQDQRFLTWGDQVVDLVAGGPAQSVFDHQDVLLENQRIQQVKPLGGTRAGQMLLRTSGAFGLRDGLRVLAADGRLLGSIDADDRFRGLAVSPDASRVAVVYDEQVVLRALPALTEQGRLGRKLHHVHWLDDRRLLGVDDEQQLAVLDVQNGVVGPRLALGSSARHVDFRPRHGLALVTLEDRAVLVRVAAPR